MKTEGSEQLAILHPVILISFSFVFVQEFQGRARKQVHYHAPSTSYRTDLHADSICSAKPTSNREADILMVLNA